MKMKIEQWEKLCAKIFTDAGVSEKDAKTIAEAAVSADMRGVTSHGTIRLATYRKRIDMGLIDPKPVIKVDVDLPGMLHIDGGNGLGQVVGAFAVEEGVKRAKANGACCVSIRNTNHMGMLSYYAMKAAEQGMISYITTNTPPFVAAVGGADPAIGTNPLCWGIPGEKFPVVLDMAISPARGKIKNALAKGEAIPEGWALDKEGNPTTDAAKAMEGVLLPVAGPKGYGLGVVVEILSGILSGGKYGNHMTHPLDDYEHKPDIGNFMFFLDIEKIMPVREFEARLQDYINGIKAGRKSSGAKEIYVPGEIEYNKITAMGDEVEVNEKVYEEISAIAGM